MKVKSKLETESLQRIVFSLQFIQSPEIDEDFVINKQWLYYS